MFESQIERNIKAYIDDMVIKSRQIEKHLTDLGEVFSMLREHKLRLNAFKYSFGVSSGKFLGYMITHRGIEVNPDQIRAINGLHSPRNPKEVQKLIGMVTALNRFISRFADKCRPFFLLLHEWKDFHWTEECVVAFEELKQYLSSPPILFRPEKEEVLYAYLAITNYAVSLVLVKNKDGSNGISTMLVSPCKRLRHVIYPWRRQYWPLCMPPGSFLIIFRLTLW